MRGSTAGSDDPELENWMPSKIHLDTTLMWDILELNCDLSIQERPAGGLLHPSLHSSVPQAPIESSTYEIVVATSPEVRVNPLDGGQTAPTSTAMASNRHGSDAQNGHDMVFAPIESLRVNPSWFWGHQAQDTSRDEFNQPYSSETVASDDGNAFWFDFETL
ncbi:hypothetical protein H2198_010797 [Neophaeococcomyces mojaviensis]|uniref:Uncharacterized protein n=1 Tax=Neophaeococcomyces mojaviensis TaxID=3383035 RepID=A0ACC2ZQZ8_9EURO|nr:hypothetical protein H2198_010797 [Knufia sp. JES_112]